MTKITEWAGCYDEGWGNDITSLSYQHPAKMARGLVKRIYSHLLDQDWLQPGDVVVDPFAGIGGTALDAITNGLSWLGCELEQRFVDLGAGCDCTGISKADWIRFYGRWDRANYKDGRHWCPACLAQAKQIDESPAVQFGLFGPPESTATYKRNSGRIPFTAAHRYRGNIDLFHSRPEAKGRAVLVQGDSRNLVSVVREAGGVVGSPPFVDQEPSHAQKDSPSKQRLLNGATKGRTFIDSSYGSTPGQLGAMPEGRAIVSSPPYAGSVNQSEAANDTEARIERMKRAGIDVSNRANVGGGNGVARQAQTYGDSTGQLGAMKEGDVSAVVSSPPWAGNSGGRGEASRNGIDPALFDRHQGGMVGGIGGEGNLAGLEPGEVEDVIVPLADGVVGSPPYEGSIINSTSNGIDWEKAGRPDRTKPSPKRISPGVDGGLNYGESTGQLGTESGETFWAAAKQILDQVAAILPPGAPAVWVIKSFVRSGQIVDFPGQWQALCEACGFETVEIVRAWLVKDKGTQIGLNGEAVKKTVARKSFFRRIYEQKRPDLAIDYEIVLFTRRLHPQPPATRGAGG